MDDVGDGRFLTADQLPQSAREMFERIAAHNGHPACGWFEKIGNGIFEDDHSGLGCPAPHWIYRFRRGATAAYVWEADGTWFVRPWRRMRGRGFATVVRVADFRAALDELVRKPRPWWRFWV